MPIYIYIYKKKTAEVLHDVKLNCVSNQDLEADNIQKLCVLCNLQVQHKNTES